MSVPYLPDLGMNITRANKKNIQKGTAAAKKREKKKVYKSLYYLIFFSAESLCVGVAASNNTVYMYIPGSVRCNVVYLPYLEVCYRPGIHLSIHLSRAAIFLCRFFLSFLSFFSHYHHYHLS